MLKEKILVGYGIAFALMTAVVVWAIINLVFLGDSSSIIYSENYRSILAAENMIDAVEASRCWTTAARSSPSPR